MSISNPHLFFETAISAFKKKSIATNSPREANALRFDPCRFYSQGHCAEFAYSLADFAHSKGITSVITIMFNQEKCPETNTLLDRTLSHCVVEIDGNSYDIKGSDARMSWFNVIGYINQDNDNIREWDFESFEFDGSPSIFEQIKKHCDIHDVPFDPEQIEKDHLIFTSISSRGSEPIGCQP